MKKHPPAYSEEEMRRIMMELGIIPDKQAILTPAGLEWRRLMTNEQWRSWAKSVQKDPLAGSNREETIRALLDRGLAQWRENLIISQDALRIYNWRMAQEYPEHPMEYSEGAIRTQVHNRSINAYRPITMKTGWQNARHLYFDYHDVFARPLTFRRSLSSRAGAKKAWETRRQRERERPLIAS